MCIRDRCLIDADFQLVSGGTDNHLMLVDLTNKDVTGKDAEHALDAAGITVNKNTIPFETRSPFVTSGVRLGTAAPVSYTHLLRSCWAATTANWVKRSMRRACLAGMKSSATKFFTSPATRES